MTAALWGLMAALSWGIGDFISRFTGRSVGVTSALFYALLVGTVLITSVTLYTHGFVLPPVKAIVLIVISGAINMVGLMCLFTSIARGPIGVATPIASAHPMLVVLFSIPLGVVPSMEQWLFMAITMAGVLLLSRLEGGEDAQGGINGEVFDDQYVRKTVRFAAGAALCFAVQVTAAQEATVMTDAQTMSMWNRAMALLALCVIMIIRKEPPTATPNLFILVLVVAHGICELGGTVSLLSGSEGQGRAIAAVVSSCFAPFTVLMAAVVLREKVSVQQWGCILIILLGVMGLSYFE